MTPLGMSFLFFSFHSIGHFFCDFLRNTFSLSNFTFFLMNDNSLSTFFFLALFYICFNGNSSILFFVVVYWFNFIIFYMWIAFITVMWIYLSIYLFLNLSIHLYITFFLYIPIYLTRQSYKRKKTNLTCNSKNNIQ